MNLTTVIGVILIILLSFGATMAHANENKALAKKHDKIMRQFAEVSHVSPLTLEAMSSEDVVVFDVREKQEYDVSHIAGAIHIEPNISEFDFLKNYAAQTQDKTVILYCSVGQRSSILARKVQTELMAQGADSVYNLEGGIFKWHNEQRPLQNQMTPSSETEETTFVHPYNRFWGRMVNDQSRVRYKIEASK